MVIRTLAISTLAAALAACAVGPDYVRPTPYAPENFVRAEATASTPAAVDPEAAPPALPRRLCYCTVPTVQVCAHSCAAPGGATVPAAGIVRAMLSRLLSLPEVLR